MNFLAVFTSAVIWFQGIRKGVSSHKSLWYLLQFHGIAVSDAGRYLCRARNSAGEAEAVAEVVVSGKYTCFMLKIQTISVVERVLLEPELHRTVGCSLLLSTWISVREISGSHSGEYEDGSLLG
jgi:hypothetical protein